MHRVGAIILAGCFLLLPHTAVSVDPPSAFCQNPEQCFAGFLEALDRTPAPSGTSSEPVKYFQQIATKYSGTVWEKRAKLRYGYWLRTSAPLEAIPLLEASLNDYPVLEDYLHFWLGQAYVEADKLHKAAEEFQEFTHRYDESLLQADALYEGGWALSKLGNCKSALSVYSQALAAEPQHPQAPGSLFQVGICAGQLGQKEKTVEVFRKLWWQYPLSQENLQAQQWLRQEEGPAYSPSLAERYQRGLTFYKNGELKKAVQEFKRFVSSSPPIPQVFQARYMLARAWVRLKQYDQAEKTLKILSLSSSSKADEAWVWLGRVFLRQGKGGQLESLVKALPLENLTGDQESQLYTFYGIWLEDQNRWTEAKKAYGKAARVAHTVSQRLKGLWRMGWIHYQRNQFVQATDIFQEMIKKAKTPHSHFSRHAVSQALYWLARSQEHIGQKESAKQYLQVLQQEYPFTYYGLLASIRLGPTKDSPPSWKILAPTDSGSLVPPVTLSQDRHYQKIHALRAVHLFGEGIRELEYVLNRHGSDLKAFPQLVSLAGEVRAYDLGIRLAIRHFGAKLRKGQLAPASPAWLGAFPMGYQALIQSFVPKHVDPFLVSGLIREESLYSARVVSPVGAIGLMQLMPTTAKRMANHLGIRDWDYDQGGLKEPRLNIQLGTHYLGQLLNEYQGNILYAVAAYNAGPQAVKRWVRQNANRPSDEFVELIGYEETRGYVKRVIGSYRIYRMLFGKTCPPVSLDRFC